MIILNKIQFKYNYISSKIIQGCGCNKNKERIKNEQNI